MRAFQKVIVFAIFGFGDFALAFKKHLRLAVENLIFFGLVEFCARKKVAQRVEHNFDRAGGEHLHQTLLLPIAEG